MITALLRTPVLRSAVDAAARPDEDVLAERADVLRAIRCAHPRVLVVDDHHARESAVEEARARCIPLLRVRDADVDGWELRRRETVPPPGRSEYYGAQLRRLLPQGGPGWIDRLLADLVRVSGRRLPASFRFLARRVLEDPSRYPTLEALAPVTGVGSAALRARFRRRGLSSPLDYLHWFRLFAVVYHLDTRKDTVSVAAMALGFQSSGNLARFTRGVCQQVPGELRGGDAWPMLVIRFATALLRPEMLEAWDSLDALLAQEA